MDLEKRVQQLEQEVEILKAQIQETLLDIQEKVLTQSYPALRKESQQVMPAPPIQQSAPVEPQQTEAPAEPTHPKKNSEPAPKIQSIEDYLPKKQAPAPRGTQAFDWSELEEMETWAAGKVKTIGLQRTRRLIQMHASKGRISAEMANALKQYLSLYEKRPQSNASNTASNSQQKERSAKSVKANAASKQQKSSSGKKSTKAKEEPKEQNLILRLIAGVGNIGVNSGKQEKKHG